MIAMVTAVVLMLKSKAFTVQIIRLRSGRLMNPTSRASAATAMPGASASPHRAGPVFFTSTHRFEVVLLQHALPPIAQYEIHPGPRQLGVLATLYCCYRVGDHNVQFLWYLYHPHLFADVPGYIADVHERSISLP